MSGHVILFGNEKGGSGKTTISAHVAIFLAVDGHKVASIDLDARQRSFTRYMENRANYAMKTRFDLPSPQHFAYPESELSNANYIEDLVVQLSSTHDIVIIDTPGSANVSSCAAHALADTIITPINDSFIDLDLLGQIQGDDINHVVPGVYSAMVWEQKVRHAKNKSNSIDWVVIRNRLSNLEAKNKQNVENALSILSKKFGFRICSAFSERVIFRELFTRGLTLMDVTRENTRTTLSHIAAKQELRSLISSLKLNLDLEKS